MYLNETAYAPSLGDRLNLADPIEVELWAKTLNLDPDDLRLAVIIAGPDYGDLVAYLADNPY
jgi:hypothetical protein